MVENSLRDKRILVVDDEPQLRRMIVDVLRAEGFCAISQAGSVMEALAVFRETNPQLALLDVMLPDGDGFTLCEYLRSLSAGAPLPVMFLTAKNETEDRLAGLRTGRRRLHSEAFFTPGARAACMRRASSLLSRPNPTRFSSQRARLTSRMQKRFAQTVSAYRSP